MGDFQSEINHAETIKERKDKFFQALINYLDEQAEDTKRLVSEAAADVKSLPFVLRKPNDNVHDLRWPTFGHLEEFLPKLVYKVESVWQEFLFFLIDNSQGFFDEFCAYSPYAHLTIVMIDGIRGGSSRITGQADGYFSRLMEDVLKNSGQKVDYNQDYLMLLPKIEPSHIAVIPLDKPE